MCSAIAVVLVVNTWSLVLSTVLAVESVSEEDVQSGVYHFPANAINGKHLLVAKQVCTSMASLSISISI